ncbi:hypothetical protein C2S53_020655, partial [Perilla frutescens var. hirtella]
MADAAAVILSAIEKLDDWLLQKPDLRDDDYAKLCSLRLEKKDLLVGMAEVWENDKEMLYSLLIGAADLWNVEGKVNNDRLYSFVGEMEDLWELNCREKLHSYLAELLMADLSKEGKLNKEKLCSWLAKKTDLWEEDNLFRLVEGMTSLEGPIKRMQLLTEEYGKYVVEVRNDLRLILDFLNKLEDQGSSHSHLHYFISDVMEMAQEELLIKLIRQFIHSETDDDVLIEKMENKALQQMLHQHLQDKPYVIVFDDVSEETYLQYVFRTLPQDKRSRLLFTTRSHQISCNPYGDCAHKMKNLDGDKSWQLLLQTALCSDKEFPKQLEKKGREMLMSKCGGLPLAIKEVGRQWAEKRRSGSKWKELVVEESLMNLVLSETIEVMEWTYLNMDAEVKPYFLRLAFFKEGTIIRKKKLIQIWTAGGPKEYQSELGLINLSQESFIEKVDKTIYSTKSIRINPIFHRLSIIKAVDEIGLEILRKDGSNRASHEPPHHRVIHCSRYDKFNYNYSSTNQDEHLVSLFVHGGGGYSSVCHPSYWKHFEQLKVLDMEGFGLKILPETVGNLIELRYLGLRNNYIQELPQSLRCLKKLEVLDIAQNIMVEVPDILWEMDCLRHLYMSNIICVKPLKIDTLMNLETLTYITVDDWTYEVSDMKNKMISLRRLGIEEVDENSNVSKLFASLAELENLYRLILRGFRFRSMPSLDELGLLKNITKLKLEGCLTRLPSANNFPPKLCKLVLVNSCLDEDPIPILEMLPQLSDLKLQNAYTGHEM